MSNSVFLVKKAIQDIMNDVVQEAFSYSIHHPQYSDQLNLLIKNATNSTSEFVNKLNQISNMSDENLKAIEIEALTKNLKKTSLVYLSEIQKIKKKNLTKN